MVVTIAKFHAFRICQCGYSKDVHSTDALQNESIESQPSTKTFPTDAFGELNSVGDEEENSDQNNIRRVAYEY